MGTLRNFCYFLLVVDVIFMLVFIEKRICIVLNESYLESLGFDLEELIKDKIIMVITSIIFFILLLSIISVISMFLIKNFLVLGVIFTAWLTWDTFTLIFDESIELNRFIRELFNIFIDFLEQ